MIIKKLIKILYVLHNIDVDESLSESIIIINNNIMILI